jgi:butyrate kinase
MIDNNMPEEGPFGPDRTGSLPVRGLIKVASSDLSTLKQLDRKVFGEGGLFAYLGTRDLKDVERRDRRRRRACVFCVRRYDLPSGEGSGRHGGCVDAVLLTGGMAFSERLVSWLADSIAWIAPVAVYPGEDELRALAEGVFRVLDGEERARRLWEEGRKPEHELGREALVIGLE